MLTAAWQLIALTWRFARSPWLN
ncbi:hypothetical protein LINGRAHAP2_LOCUS30909 [Linum grandiflorum]